MNAKYKVLLVSLVLVLVAALSALGFAQAQDGAEVPWVFTQPTFFGEDARYFDLIEEEGNLNLSWHSDYNVYYAKSEDGKNWSVPEQVTDNGLYSQVTVYGSSVVVSFFDATTHLLMTSVRNSAGTWHNPVQVPLDPIFPFYVFQRLPELRFLSDGKLALVFLGFVDYEDGREYAPAVIYSDDLGLSWSDPTMLEPSATGDGFLAEVRGDKILISWRDGNKVKFAEIHGSSVSPVELVAEFDVDFYIDEVSAMPDGSNPIVVVSAYINPAENNESFMYQRNDTGGWSESFLGHQDEISIIQDPEIGSLMFYVYNGTISQYPYYMKELSSGETYFLSERASRHQEVVLGSQIYILSQTSGGISTSYMFGFRVTNQIFLPVLMRH